MTDSKDIMRFTDEGCVVAWDLRYHPILISHIRGKSTMAAADFYYSARNPSIIEADKRGQKIVTINDMTKWEMPPASIRKSIGDQAKDDVRFNSIVLYINVVPSAMIRGVITAILWVASDDKLAPVKVASSMDEAFAMARKALMDAGCDNVPDIKNYSLPDA